MKIKLFLVSTYIIILFISILLSGCSLDNSSNPSDCDCKTVHYQAFGDDEIHAGREAMIRINGNDRDFNTDAVLKCHESYKKEFAEWKKNNDPNRSWNADWELFFSDKCK